VDPIRYASLALFALLLATAPLAAAPDDVDVRGDTPCGSILGDGVVAYAVCMAGVATCLAWRAVWGQDQPCP
jgi:hypothetical protein